MEGEVGGCGGAGVVWWGDGGWIGKSGGHVGVDWGG